jgi:outer membrane protein TolC
VTGIRWNLHSTVFASEFKTSERFVRFLHARPRFFPRPPAEFRAIFRTIDAMNFDFKPAPMRSCLAASLLVLAALVAPPAQAQHTVTPPADTPALTIERAVDLARTRNERARAAVERIDAAQARVSKARSAFLPTITVGGTYTRRAFETVRMVGDDQITIQSLNALGASADARMTLLDVRLFPAFSQMRHDRDATRLEQRNAVRALAFDAANAFLEALGARQVAEAARNRRELAQRNLDAARARFDAQLVGSNDVTRAELELATAERELTAAHGAEEASRLDLALLLNVDMAGDLVFPADLLDAATTSTHDAGALAMDAVARRPDLAALRARAMALDASSTEAVLRVLPSLGLQAQYRITNEAGFSGRNTNWFVGANLNWTLFDGGAWLADRQERSALATATHLEAAALERSARADVRIALVSLANAQAAIRQATVARDVARTNARETSELYRQGLTTALAVADAGVRLFEADVALAREQYALASAYLGVRAAVGLDPLGKELSE